MLEQGLIKLGYTPEEIATMKGGLESYAKELELFNKAYDLVGADTYEDIIIKHVLDSMAGQKEICRLKNEILASGVSEKDFVIADIGTGGGLPGIPLAISMPDTKFVLIERMTKRCRFLENCIAVLGLKNVTVQCLEAERVPQQSFDMATFRAFRPLEKKMTRVLLRTLKKPHGLLAAYKAKSEKIAEEMEGIKQWAPNFSIVPLSVPFLEDRERHLVIIPGAQESSTSGV